MSWMTWILFVSLLWIYSVCISDAEKCSQKYKIEKLKKCVRQQKTSLVIFDDFRGVFNGSCNQSPGSASGSGSGSISGSFSASASVSGSISGSFSASASASGSALASASASGSGSGSAPGSGSISGSASGSGSALALASASGSALALASGDDQANQCSQETGAGKGCIVFLRKKQTEKQGFMQVWPQMMTKDGSYLLLISQWHIMEKLHLHVLKGKHCNYTSCYGTDSACVFNHTLTDSCQIRCVDTGTICNGRSYGDKICSEMMVKDRYIINITATNNNCISCNNPVRKPEKKITLNTTIITEGEKLDITQASAIMNAMPDLVADIESLAEVIIGEGLQGGIVTQRDPKEVDQVLFAYKSPHDSINIIDNEDALAVFPRSGTIPKEAFEKSLNVSVPFAVIFWFNNLTLNESDSTVLNDEVLAVTMATEITNLTDKISLNFNNVTYKGTPSCQSWNGEGSQPNWTGDGCETIIRGNNITCACSHLTFFAILLAPPNVTISSSDLRKLTTITQIGCGVSMFFLGIVLFMHFLLRRTKASISTRILIHLVSALFLLNLTFLTNNYVAKLKSSVGCKIMAALMHYFMLATFTWFAVQAFHICQQLYMGGKTVIRHYMIKVCITSWVLPSIVGIVLLSIGKYGEQAILTSDSTESLSMCWITDTEVHSIVNIGYYALVFIFTTTTFITIVSWLCCLRRVGAGTETNGNNIVIILGLCCMLGITWGFAFFAHGILRIPAYYIFTVLNSFQGFFLFIYYWKTSHSKEVMGSVSDINSSSNTSTLKTRVDIFENPYSNPPEREKMPGNTGGE